MTDQEAFDIMVRHLATMTHKSANTLGDDCMYRAPDGNKCVVGALIPDDAYVPAMEGWTAEGVLGRHSLPELVDVNPAMLSSMQDIHDTGAWSGDGFADWTAVRVSARLYGLSDAVVDEVLA